MMCVLETYNPFYSYFGEYCFEGSLFDAKKQCYRLISLLLSILGIIFDIRSPSSWHIISELHARGIIDDSFTANIKASLSIANEIRLKTYFANGGQKEMFSPLHQYQYIAEEPDHIPIFRDFNENSLVRLLSTSNILFKYCIDFGNKYIEQDEIDVSIFKNPLTSSSKATLMGYLYFRLQNFPKALEWMISESDDSPDYVHSLTGQSVIYLHRGDYEKAIELSEAALEVHSQNGKNTTLNVFTCINSIAVMLQRLGQYEKAKKKVEEGVNEHLNINGDSLTIQLSHLMHTLGDIHFAIGDARKALDACKIVEQIHESLTQVPDKDVIYAKISMAKSLSFFGEYEQSLEYVKQALQRSYRVFGKNDLSFFMAKLYMCAGDVYRRCQRNDEALSFFKQSLEIYEHQSADSLKSGKVLIMCECYNITICCQSLSQCSLK